MYKTPDNEQTQGRRRSHDESMPAHVDLRLGELGPTTESTFRRSSQFRMQIASSYSFDTESAHSVLSLQSDSILSSSPDA